MSRNETVGLLGIGHIAAALVTGWREGGAGPAEIILSPRNAGTANALARRFDCVRVAADNQAILDQAEIVLLCVRPQVVTDVLRDLRFRSDHRVLSLVATYELERLAPLIAPATALARAVPMPFVAKRRGPLAAFPPADWALELLAPLGDVIAVSDAAAFNRFCAITATMSSFCTTLATMSAWLVAGGIPPESAERYLAGFAKAMSLELPDEPPMDLATLAGQFATRGGINEFFAAELARQGGFDLVSTTLDRVLERIEGRAALPRDGDQ